MTTVRVIDRDRFEGRLADIKLLIDMALQAVESMRRAGEISDEDAASCRLADDTAAWVCGRVETSNCVTLRLRCSTFAGSKVLPTLYYYDEYLRQKLLPETDRKYFIYWRYTIPMIKLIVAKTEDALIDTNPCAQLAYLIDLVDKQVLTRDCRCDNQSEDDLVLDPMNDHHRTVNMMHDLVDEPYDDGIVRVTCSCKREKVKMA